MTAIREKIAKNQRGFNLLSVIIAIFVLAVGLTAIIGMVNSSIRASNTTKNKIIASGLAQEGIELVRNFRGNSDDWDEWFGSISAGDYRVRHDSSGLLAFSDSFLRLDPDTGLYQYSTGPLTIFKRKITVVTASANVVRFQSIVTWTERGEMKTLEVENRLWNWR